MGHGQLCQLRRTSVCLVFVTCGNSTEIWRVFETLHGIKAGLVVFFRGFCEGIEPSVRSFWVPVFDIQASHFSDASLDGISDSWT